MVLLDENGSVVPDRVTAMKEKRSRWAGIRRKIKKAKEIGIIRVNNEDL